MEGRRKHKVSVDDELYIILRAMRENAMVDRAIRSYAKAFIGKERWKELEEKLLM